MNTDISRLSTPYDIAHAKYNIKEGRERDSLLIKCSEHEQPSCLSIIITINMAVVAVSSICVCVRVRVCMSINYRIKRVFTGVWASGTLCN